MNLRKLLTSLLLIAALWGIAYSRLAESQTAKNIGELMWQSTDISWIRDSCLLSYDFRLRKFRCNSSIKVRLSRGYETVVYDRRVTDRSEITCDCRSELCSDGGMVLGYVRVARIMDGGFVLRHAYALGGEILSCRIN
ncbi:MAG: hypothetical protein QXS54_03720 [Candidatus Methanomethylicaceae archaeon]